MVLLMVGLLCCAPAVQDLEFDGLLPVAKYRAPIPEGMERVWIGPDFHANRLQDWRLRDGRIECVEAARSKPVRTLHILPLALSGGGTQLEIAVRIGRVDPEGELPEDAFAGILLGCGSPQIDYRLSALAHHRPGRDGGVAVGFDRESRVVFRNFDHNVRGGSWSIDGPLAEGEFESLPAEDWQSWLFLNPAAKGSADGGLILRVAVRYHEGAPTLCAEVRDGRTGATVSSKRIMELRPGWLDGGIALVSHLGPEAGAGGFWFKELLLDGGRVNLRKEGAVGPVRAVQYTVSGGVLKLTAQLPPLGEDDSQNAELRMPVGEDGAWETVSTALLRPDSYTLPFRVEPWTAEEDVPYRIHYLLKGGGPSPDWPSTYRGTIRAAPKEDEELVVAGLTCNKNFTGGLQWNHDAIWFPHQDLVRRVGDHDPDLVFFAGDQIYEGDLTGAVRRPLAEAKLDYLDKWLRWCWAFGELTKDRPTITIPDDHDVYHGNLWGAGGRHAPRQDDGGYRMDPSFVRMVEATQTSHLPDAYDPTPVEQGIGVYYTSLAYGGVSFAILEDRKFKSSPTAMLPEGKVVNGWFQNADYDPATQADAPGAVLLGERQLRFLEEWARREDEQIWTKVVLSQTLFGNLATLPAGSQSDSVVPGLEIVPAGGYPPDDQPVADADSNGWPPSGRNRALRWFREADALHLCGDQHLASVVRYGVDDWEDSGTAFCLPSIANTWPRRWYPATPGESRAPGAPRYTGRFLDGFGNRLTVVAVANPVASGHEPARLHDRAPGYGIVRFRKASRTIVLECWPRWVDPLERDARQYPGWPVTIRRQAR